MNGYTYPAIFLHYKTQEEVLAQINRIREEVKQIGGGVDLNDYYNKGEVNQLIEDLKSLELSRYYTKNEIDDMLSNISDIDLSDYYTRVEIDAMFENIQDIELSEYYTKDEVDMKISNTLSQYMTRSEVESYVENKLSDVEVDLSDYYTKTEVDNKISSKANKINRAYFTGENFHYNLVNGYFINDMEVQNEWLFGTEVEHMMGIGVQFSYDYSESYIRNYMNNELDKLEGQSIGVYIKATNVNSYNGIEVVIVDTLGQDAVSEFIDTSYVSGELNYYDSYVFLTVPPNASYIEIRANDMVIEHVTITNSANIYYSSAITDYIDKQLDISTASIIGPIIQNMQALVNNLKD